MMCCHLGFILTPNGVDVQWQFVQCTNFEEMRYLPSDMISLFCELKCLIIGGYCDKVSSIRLIM